MQRACTSLFISTLFFATFGCLMSSTAQAQDVITNITSDTTLPNPTQVNQNDNIIEITGGTRPKNGNNLFHSFGNFSVGTGDIASFQNVSDIANIFSRVTGGNMSEIDGMIRTIDSSANLYLINPNGIIFGQNAQLNLGGSFFASTADSLLFEGNTEFSASNPQAAPLLEVNIPIGLNFRDNPGGIVNNSVPDDNGSLSVSPGATFALLGGNINFTGGIINSRSSNIFIGGLSESGTISLDENLNASFPEGIARADVTFTNGSNITVNAGGGGSITIDARNIELSQSFLLAGITIDPGSYAAQAGKIILNATDNINVTQGSEILNLVGKKGIGNAGEIDITAANLYLTQGGKVNTSTFGKGNGGAITINASGTISAKGKDEAGRNSGIFSDVQQMWVSALLSTAAPILSSSFDPSVGRASWSSYLDLISRYLLL